MSSASSTEAMSEWTPELELALEAYATFEEQRRWLSDSEHERIGWMRAALAEIRRLREESAAKSSSLSVFRIDGARAMHTKCLEVAEKFAQLRHADSARNVAEVIRSLNPEEV